MIIYALIARGSLILAEYSPYKEDFAFRAKKLLSQSQPNTIKKQFVFDGCLYTYFTEDDFTFLCLSKTNTSKEFINHFLDNLAELFFSNQGKYEHNASIKSFSGYFSKKIKDLIV